MKKVVVLLMLIVFNSCFKVDCDVLAETFQDEQCEIIVTQSPDSGTVFFNAKGKNLLTKEQCNCKTKNRWWNMYSHLISKGDTIIKKKGELIFSIHKKDTIYNFNWECDGKIYK